MLIRRKPSRILLLLVLMVTALSGCLGTGGHPVAIREQGGMADIQLPVADKKTVDLSMEPADATLTYTTDRADVVAVTALDHDSLSVEALQAGTATVRVIAKRQGYKDSVFSFDVTVYETELPTLQDVRFWPAQLVAGQERTLDIAVDTWNVSDGTLVQAELLDHEGLSLDPAIVQTQNIERDHATLTLIIPAHVVGEHQVMVSVDGLEPHIEEYSIVEEGIEPLQLIDVYAEPMVPVHVAGEPLYLTVHLSQGGEPAADGDYMVEVWSRFDVLLLHRESHYFVDGRADILLAEPLVRAGEHVLIVEVAGSHYSFDIPVVPAEHSGLEVVVPTERGTANEPLSGPPTAFLVDSFGNVITEGDHVIRVETSGGFVSGTELVSTDSDGLAVFSDLVLYEGEYTLTFIYDDLEVSAPVTVGYEGYGDAYAPYQIHNLYGLHTIRNDLNAHYQLANDIDAADTALSSGGWVPIQGFAGSLSGDSYTIYDLNINRSSDNLVGLFSTIAPDGVVSDITLARATVTGKDNVGTLAGRNSGRISQSSVLESQVDGNQAVGGVVGDNRGTITHSASHAQVAARSDAGGLAGTNAGLIEYSYASGRTSASGISSYAGGVVGSNRGHINRCYALGWASGSPVGGLVGRNQNHGSGVITESYAAVSLAGVENRGGLTGLSFGSVSASYSDYEAAGITYGAGEHKSTLQMKQRETYVGWDFESVWDMEASINDGYPFLREVQF